MVNLIYKLTAHLPSKGGREKLRILMDRISQEPIKFTVEQIVEDGRSYFLAASTNAADGKIITSGETLDELNLNIKDAIFTAFDVPSYYCDFNLIKEQAEVKQLAYATT